MGLTVSTVILAAGASSRMKAPKPLLRGREATLLEEAASPFLPLGPVVVVTGFHAHEVEHVARSMPVRVVRNPAAGRGMMSSVCTGLRAVGRTELVFIHPVDCPGVSPFTLRAMVATWAAFPWAHAVIPLASGVPGHPLLLDSRATSLALAARGPSSLHELLSRLGYAIVRVETGDPAVTRDLDTEDQLARYRRA